MKAVDKFEYRRGYKLPTQHGDKTGYEINSRSSKNNKNSSSYDKTTNKIVRTQRLIL